MPGRIGAAVFFVCGLILLGFCAGEAAPDGGTGAGLSLEYWGRFLRTEGCLEMRNPIQCSTNVPGDQDGTEKVRKSRRDREKTGCH